MMDATMDHRRTGLTRAKRIEQLALWLGLPLLLALLSLTAGIVNYTPVRQHVPAAKVEPVPAAAETAPAEEAVPTIQPLRPAPMAPSAAPDDLGRNLQLDHHPSIS